ncbi:hypothetical protein LINPERPRIM_LOCUS33557 [Linum perenne]
MMIICDKHTQSCSLWAISVLFLLDINMATTVSTSPLMGGARDPRGRPVCCNYLRW